MLDWRFDKPQYSLNAGLSLEETGEGSRCVVAGREIAKLVTKLPHLKLVSVTT